MNKAFLSLIVYGLLINPSFGQNPFWVQKDKRIISDLSTVNKSRPQEVEDYFTQRGNKPLVKESLGFGWAISTPRVAGGYVSISGTLVYYNDTIVSYSLYPELPSDEGLLDKYKQWFSGTFNIDSGGGIEDFKFRRELLSKPLEEYNGSIELHDLSQDILDYMSPHAGTMYGYSGGYNNSLLENRRNFLNVKERLTPEIVYLFLHSINPATRLTAIEYYKEHADKFNNREVIELWIARVFKEVPSVWTMMGCIIKMCDSRLLVEFWTGSQD